MILTALAAAAEPSLSCPASATAPMNYLESFGVKADRIVSLTWGLLAISILVTVLMTALVLWAVLRKREPQTDAATPRQLNSLAVFGGGLGVTTLILAGCVVWTMATLAAIDHPPRKPGLRIEITGQQWWWDVRYESSEPQKNFSTANEIHVPTGVPVELKLRSRDVIHSFWIPALGGKTDVIPGQVNTTWFEASKPGTYLGQCSEYCGVQHAHMALTVVAEAPEKFEAWRNDQIKSAPAPSTNDAKAGLVAFESRCAGCHAIRGTEAGGVYGPNLSHLMTRASLGDGAAPNRSGFLAGWIADPQHLKPGTKMPRVALSGEELQAITAYLKTLN